MSLVYSINLFHFSVHRPFLRSSLSYTRIVRGQNDKPLALTIRATPGRVAWDRLWAWLMEAAIPKDSTDVSVEEQGLAADPGPHSESAPAAGRKEVQ